MLQLILLFTLLWSNVASASTSFSAESAFGEVRIVFDHIPTIQALITYRPVSRRWNRAVLERLGERLRFLLFSFASIDDFEGEMSEWGQFLHHRTFGRRLFPFVHSPRQTQVLAIKGSTPAAWLIHASLRTGLHGRLARIPVNYRTFGSVDAQIAFLDALQKSFPHRQLPSLLAPLRPAVLAGHLSPESLFRTIGPSNELIECLLDTQMIFRDELYDHIARFHPTAFLQRIDALEGGLHHGLHSRLLLSASIHGLTDVIDELYPLFRRNLNQMLVLACWRSPSVETVELLLRLGASPRVRSRLVVIDYWKKGCWAYNYGLMGERQRHAGSYPAPTSALGSGTGLFSWTALEAAHARLEPSKEILDLLVRHGAQGTGTRGICLSHLKRKMKEEAFLEGKCRCYLVRDLNYPHRLYIGEGSHALYLLPWQEKAGRVPDFLCNRVLPGQRIGQAVLVLGFMRSEVAVAHNKQLAAWTPSDIINEFKLQYK